jgi:hypothetical protein
MQRLPSKKSQAYMFRFFYLLFFLVPVMAAGQRIQYSEIEREDGRTVNFEIIGKVSGNLLVYKSYRSDNIICVYDNDMKLKQRVKLKDMPERIINADFIGYPNYGYMIYQFQKKNVIHCMAVKIGGNGQPIGEQVELDTTQIGVFQSNNKIYSMLNSEDRQRIMMIKVNRKNDRNHIVTAMLYDTALNLQFKHRMGLAMPNRSYYLTEFHVDNEGDLFFAKCQAGNNNEYVQKLELGYKPSNSETVQLFPMDLREKTLDEIRMKPDNANRKMIINAFYYTKKNGNIDGLYVNIWNKTNLKSETTEINILNDTLRLEAKGEASVKTAFNDFFIDHIIPKKDGGFILSAESSYSSGNSNNPWSRWDYLNRYPYYTSYDYYDLGGRSWYWNSADRWGGRQSVTWHNDNVAVFSFSNKGQLMWSNVVHKDQSDDYTQDFLSYQVIITGGQLHFLFNSREKNDLLMFDHSVSPTGHVTRNPTLKNLDRQHTIMPRHGKQINNRQMVFPCFYKNYLCFAKIDY